MDAGGDVIHFVRDNPFYIKDCARGRLTTSTSTYAASQRVPSAKTASSASSHHISRWSVQEAPQVRITVRSSAPPQSRSAEPRTPPQTLLTASVVDSSPKDDLDSSATSTDLDYGQPGFVQRLRERFSQLADSAASAAMSPRSRRKRFPSVDDILGNDRPANVVAVRSRSAHQELGKDTHLAGHPNDETKGKVPGSSSSTGYSSQEDDMVSRSRPRLLVDRSSRSLSAHGRFTPEEAKYVIGPAEPASVPTWVPRRTYVSQSCPRPSSTIVVVGSDDMKEAQERRGMVIDENIPPTSFLREKFERNSRARTDQAGQPEPVVLRRSARSTSARIEHAQREPHERAVPEFVEKSRKLRKSASRDAILTDGRLPVNDDHGYIPTRIVNFDIFPNGTFPRSTNANASSTTSTLQLKTSDAVRSRKVDPGSPPADPQPLFERQPSELQPPTKTQDPIGASTGFDRYPVSAASSLDSGAVSPPLSTASERTPPPDEPQPRGKGGSDVSEDLSEDRQSEVSSDEPTSYDITSATANQSPRLGPGLAPAWTCPGPGLDPSATAHHELKKANDQPPVVMRKKLGFTLPLDSAFEQTHEDKVAHESESSVAGIRIGRPGSTPITAAPKISMLSDASGLTEMQRLLNKFNAKRESGSSAIVQPKEPTPTSNVVSSYHDAALEQQDDTTDARASVHANADPHFEPVVSNTPDGFNNEHDGNTEPATSDSALQSPSEPAPTQKRPAPPPPPEISATATSPVDEHKQPPVDQENTAPPPPAAPPRPTNLTATIHVLPPAPAPARKSLSARYLESKQRQSGAEKTLDAKKPVINEASTASFDAHPETATAAAPKSDTSKVNDHAVDLRTKDANENAKATSPTSSEDGEVQLLSQRSVEASEEDAHGIERIWTSQRIIGSFGKNGIDKDDWDLNVEEEDDFGADFFVQRGYHRPGFSMLASDGNPVRHSLLNLAMEEDIPDLLEAMAEECHFVFEDYSADMASTSSIIHSASKRQERRKKRNVDRINFANEPPKVFAYLDENAALEEGWMEGCPISYDDYQKIVQSAADQTAQDHLELTRWRHQMERKYAEQEDALNASLDQLRTTAASAAQRSAASAASALGVRYPYQDGGSPINSSGNSSNGSTPSPTPSGTLCGTPMRLQNSQTVDCGTSAI